METGLTHTSTLTVEDKHLAARVGSGDLEVLATPAMMALMENAAMMAVKDALLISAPVMILTEGGPFRSTETVMYFYYLEAFKSGNRAVESTIATLSAAVSMLSMALIAIRRKHALKDI